MRCGALAPLLIVTALLAAPAPSRARKRAVMCHKYANGSPLYCALDCLCGHGEGHCSDASYCEAGLRCAKGVGAEFVAGTDASFAFCVRGDWTPKPKPKPPPPPPPPDAEKEETAANAKADAMACRAYRAALYVEERCRLFLMITLLLIGSLVGICCLACCMGQRRAVELVGEFEQGTLDAGAKYLSTKGDLAEAGVPLEVDLDKYKYDYYTQGLLAGASASQEEAAATEDLRAELARLREQGRQEQQRAAAEKSRHQMQMVDMSEQLEELSSASADNQQLEAQAQELKELVRRTELNAKREQSRLEAQMLEMRETMLLQAKAEAGGNVKEEQRLVAQCEQDVSSTQERMQLEKDIQDAKIRKRIAARQVRIADRDQALLFHFAFPLLTEYDSGQAPGQGAGAAKAGAAAAQHAAAGRRRRVRRLEACRPRAIAYNR